MESRGTCFRLVIAVGLVLLAVSVLGLNVLNPAGVPPPARGSEPGVPVNEYSSTPEPQGVSASWSAGARESLRKAEYDLSWQDRRDLPGVPAAWQAANRAHNFRTYFTPEGPETVSRTATTAGWRWGMSLRRWGYVGQARPVSEATLYASGNRAEYRREGLTEWYVNDERGIEQGFTLDAPAPGQRGGTTWTALEIELTGTLKPRLHSAGTGVLLTTTEGAGVIRYGKLEAFDASRRRLPTRLELVDNRVALMVDTRDALYPVTVDPLATSATWTGEGNQISESFGYSVSTAGDVNGDGYSDVIVGAPNYDSGQSNEGAAFLYLGSASGLSLTSAWTREGNQIDAEFGSAVATAGDVNGDGYSDVIVGAHNYDNDRQNAGRAYVYLGSASGLETSPIWTGETHQAEAEFGYAVATAGDVNADGYSDIIVGTNGWYTGESVEGGAFLYLGSASGPSVSPDWTAEGNQSGAYFGISVSTAGDVNGDGYSDVAVGADSYNNGEGSAGRVFVYLGSASGLNISAGWTAESHQPGSRFGCSVSTAGDVNGDGYSDLVVGAYWFDLGETDEGAAFLYLGSAGGLDTFAAWTGQGDQASAVYGRSVSTAGDVNGDGYSDVVVGASYYDNGQTDEGRAFLYLGSASGLSTASSWTAEADQDQAYYGHSVATAGDVNGDGYSDVIVGAFYFDGSFFHYNEGGAFLFPGSAAAPAVSSSWMPEGNQATAQFGSVVCSAGDVNGDGFSDVIVSAPGFTNGETHEGRVSVYLGTATGLSGVASWTAESNQAFAYLGVSAAGAGDVNADGYSDVIVGSRAYSNGQVNEGAAFLYLGSATGLGSSPAWTAEGNQDNARFGSHLSPAGDVNGDGFADVIVTAPSYDNGQADEGAVFVYYGTLGGLRKSPAWTLESNQANAGPEMNGSTAGDVNRDGYSDVIVGLPSFSNGQTSEGLASIYFGSATGLGSTPVWSVEGNESYLRSGYVHPAGDVNGDGYSDVIVGSMRLNGSGPVALYLGFGTGPGTTPTWTLSAGQAGAGSRESTAGDVNGDGYSDIVIAYPGYDNGLTDQGFAAMYFGSPSGFPTGPVWSVEGDENDTWFGSSVASAGDINGDGYSDVIVGAPWLSNGQANEGRSYLFYGNEGVGVSLKPRQRRFDNTAPVDHLGLSGNSSGFRLRTLARTPYGRGKAKLQWEIKPLGMPFDGTGTGQSAAWTDTSITGFDLNQQVTVASAGVYHWRMRLLYNPVTTPFQPSSRWISPFGNGWQEADLRAGEIPKFSINVFFTAPDNKLSELRTDQNATHLLVSTLPGGGSSSHSPGLAVYLDNQMLAVKGATNSNILIKSRLRDGSFSDSTWTQVPGTTSAGPALCVFNNRLYLFVKAGTGSGVFYRYVDASGALSPWWSVSGSNTLWRPGLVVFGGRLYCFESDAAANRLWYKSMDTAGTWGDWAMIPTGSTNAAPTPVVQGGKIWLFVKGLAGKVLWWSATPTPGTPSSWSPWLSCSGSSEAAPGVALDPAENLFHLVVRGNMVPRLWHRTFDPATLVWSEWHLLTNLDPAAQSIDAPTVVPVNW